MTVSKRELRSFFRNLHPLDLGLVFKVYKKSNYDDILFDKLSGKRNKCITKNLYIGNKFVRNQKNNKIRVKYLEFIKFLAENLFEMNIRDLGYLQSSELQEIFQYIKENESSIDKIYTSHKLEGILFSVLKTHIIYILESSILLSEISEIKFLIEGLWSLLLQLEVNIEDLFHNINKDELIQIFNLICYFSDLKQKIVLDENLDKLLIKILNILKVKIKNHFNVLLQYSLDITETIGKPNQSEWINLLSSEDIVISNEDLLLYFILKNFNGNYNDNLKRVLQIIRFNLLSDSAKGIYSRIQRPILNSSNLSRNKYFANNTQIASCVTNKPKTIILNNISDNFQLPILNKHLIIDNNFKVDGCFSYEIRMISRSKLKFPGDFNDLVKTWKLFLGFSIKTGKKYQPFAFNLFSLLGENSDKNDTSKLFHHRSILKSSKFNHISGNISKNEIMLVPAPYYEEENCLQGKVVIQWEGIVLANSNGDEILEDDNRVIFAVNWREKFILVEIGSLFSVYVEILDGLLEENGLEIQNDLVFPLISYNDEYFNATVNYYSCNLGINERQISLKERLDQECKKRFIGSKTRRKLFTDVSKKQSGAPKRVTRLRPSGSTNMVISFPSGSLNSPQLSASSPANKRGRPRKNTTTTCIKELVPMNCKEYYPSLLSKVSKKNDSKNISKSTRAQGSNSLVIKKIKKKIKVNTDHYYSYNNSFLGRFFANSFKKLLSFFRGRLI
ncbi:uncharacterized protein cubi_03458 [Cryptosporidium ubiquitum]|uniref:Uncharacterized protein n=1 Tax=Cryptosporidium ubiquitum TaxID=857276 RepID=A0A1J4MKW3_9CRYT|nr:uncharacterized protein cubi_03458 [Cryptosporidium ubiquitum]OII73660.1 hypothetical protein cubi_03458 [Cryptosporidium ubiquitum]